MRMAAAWRPMAATMIVRTAGGIATALPRAEELILPTVRPRAQRGRRLFAAAILDMRYT